MGEEKKKIFYSSQVPTKSVAIKPRHAKIIFYFFLGGEGINHPKFTNSNKQWGNQTKMQAP